MPEGGESAPGAGAWLGGLLFLLLCYRLLVGPLTGFEWVAGALAAALATVAACVVAARVPPFRPRWAWIALVLRRLAVRMLVDCLRVLAAVAAGLASRKPLRGKFRVVPFDGGDDDARSNARRALVTAAASLPPNSLVVTIDRGSGLLLVHQLLPARERPGGGDREWPV